MIKFFRKQTSHIKTSWFNYALDTVVVIVGVLIALAVSNWNESKKNTTKLKHIYKIIQQDLKTDTANLSKIITWYERFDSLQSAIIFNNYPKSYLNAINENNYNDKWSIGHCLIVNWNNFKAQDKGYELLKNYDEESFIEEDNLSVYIMEFYTYFFTEFKTSADVIKDQLIDNLQYLEQYPWYIDMLFNKYNRESIIFYTQNKTYKKKVAYYNMLITDNYLRDLKRYRERSVIIIERIEKRVNEQKTN